MDMLNERIRKLRDEKGINQNDMADVLHVSRSTYSNYERGTVPDTSIIRQIANYYNVSVSYLFGETNERSLNFSAFDTLMNQLDRFQTGDPGATFPPELLSDLLQALILYHTSGKPVGALPITVTKAVIESCANLLKAANTHNVAQLIDAANALAAAGLQSTDIIKAYVDRNTKEIPP